MSHDPESPSVGSSDPSAAHPRRLLILGCSKAKVSNGGLISALQRYDGPAFRVLRRYLHQQPEEPPLVYILSAEFGLIPIDQPIPDYDRRMSSARAIELRSQVASTLSQILTWLETDTANELNFLIILGKDYLPALPGVSEPKSGCPRFWVVDGSQGRKLAVLRDWLYQAPPETARSRHTLGQPRSFRGVVINASRNDVLEAARRGLREQGPRATNLVAWAVPIDGQRVAPKWLVSQVTGRPVSGFTTSEALGLLARLGIAVERA